MSSTRIGIITIALLSAVLPLFAQNVSGINADGNRQNNIITAVPFMMIMPQASATGCGKSFLACALGRSSCLLGYRTQYFSMNKFLDALAQARLDGSYLKWIRGISANKLLILDDFGLKALNNDARIALLDILEDRYGNGATMITSQLPVDSWYNFIDEPTLADAIMDRLAASAHRIALTGKSLRKKKNH